MRLPGLIVLGLLIATPASAATITFFDTGDGVTFTSDDPLTLAVDCPGTTSHCVVQQDRPLGAVFIQCAVCNAITIGDPTGTIVREFINTTGGGDTGHPFSRYGFFAEMVPGLFRENGNFGIFPPGTVGFGNCQDYLQGCLFREDGLLHTAFTENFFGQSENLSPPFPLLGLNTVRFQLTSEATPAPVPEPTSLLLLGTGLAALRKRRR